MNGSARRPSATALIILAATTALVVLPLVGTEFFVNFVLTRTLILGLAASTIVFLSSYVGMVSLAQNLLPAWPASRSATAWPSRARA